MSIRETKKTNARELLIQHMLDQKTIAEIADLYGISISTASTLIASDRRLFLREKREELYKLLTE